MSERKPLVARQTDGRPYSQPVDQSTRIFHLGTEINGRSGNVLDAYSREDAVNHAAKLIAVANNSLVASGAMRDTAEALVAEAEKRQPTPVKRKVTDRAQIMCQVRVGSGSLAVESL